VRSPQSFGLDPERATLAANLIELNMQVHDRAIGLVGPIPPPPELTMQQFRVLGQVVRRPGISGNELGGLLGVSAPTASGLIERLVEKGLITGPTTRTTDASGGCTRPRSAWTSCGTWTRCSVVHSVWC